MTITFSGGTGVSTTGAARGTTSTTVAYNNVSAGRMAVLTVAVKPNTATINTPTDAAGNTWIKLGEGTGGTGSNAADTGQTKVAKFYRVLSGSESGNITCTGTSSGSIQAVLDVYAKTRASWDLSQYVTASDATHGTNHSATSGTFGDYGVNDTDWLLVGHSGDTDDATTATSAPTITQSGSTIGTVAARSELRNTSGNQGRTATWSAPVTTAGSNTAAVVSGFTWSVSSCGPDITARLREYDEFNTLTDDFSSTLDTAKWIASGSAATSGGALVLNITGSTTVQSVGNHRLVNNAVTVHTTDFPTTGSTYYAGMRVGPRGNGGGDFIGIYYHGDGTITFERSGTTTVTITLDETAHQWIRIQHDGTNVLLRTSPDGTTWTTRRTVLPADFGAWVSSNGVEVVFEGAEGDSWSLDDFNLAPTSEVHTTSGTASAAATATATRSTTRTTAHAAVAAATASATRATVRTTTGTATAAAAASVARSTVRVTAGTASAAGAASAAVSGVRPTARTAAAAATASGVASTARATAGSGAAAAAASGVRTGVHVTTASASASAVASASVAGVRPTARTATGAATASAAVGTIRVTARSAGAAAAASAVRSGIHVTEGTAAASAVATGVVEGEESHTSTGTATAAATASAARSGVHVPSGTGTASATAAATLATARVTAGAAAAAATASAISGGTEAHTTSGTAVAVSGATSSFAGVHVVAVVGAAAASASAARATVRVTSSAASATATASATKGSGPQGGSPRQVSGGRAPRQVSADRQGRIVDSTRLQRRLIS